MFRGFYSHIHEEPRWKAPCMILPLIERVWMEWSQPDATLNYICDVLQLPYCHANLVIWCGDSNHHRPHLHFPRQMKSPWRITVSRCLLIAARAARRHVIYSPIS